MSQPNPSAELEELIAETRAQAIRETAIQCLEICRELGAQDAACAIKLKFLAQYLANGQCNALSGMLSEVGSSSTQNS